MHTQSLSEKITYLEQVIGDLEQKNKRLTDMLNSQVYNKAQQYKENVLTKLLDRRRTPHDQLEQPGSLNTSFNNKENSVNLGQPPTSHHRSVA